jgi:hypothetical protein
MGSHEPQPEDSARKSALSRRHFITRGSVAVAAAGVVASVPGLTSALALGGSEAPAAGSVVADVAAGASTEPIVAHVTDLATGEISVFSGTQEVVFRDQNLARRLFNASR